jgi:hypothetical protein
MIAELQFVDTPDGAGSAGVFTKLYFADISRKLRSGTLRGNMEYAMALALLLDASTAIQAHAFAAMAAFALGVVQQDGLSCQSRAKSASGPLCRLRRCSIATKWDGPDVRADERRASRALAEADLSSAKRRPPVLIRQSSYWQACQAGGQLWKIESLRTRNG